MIEVHARLPVLVVVAGLAAGFQRAAVDVIAAMAAGAGRGQLLRCRAARVAGVAVEFRVAPEQRELRLLRMIESNGAPGIVVVAGGAILAEAARMRVDILMAADAGLRQFVLEISAAMAPGAVERAVPAEQREAGFLRVVELRGLPAGFGVALRAVVAARAAVYVVRRVAGIAAQRSVLVSAGDVAGGTGGITMRRLQRKAGLVMIEAGADPTTRAVTGTAIRAQRAAVHVD